MLSKSDLLAPKEFKTKTVELDGLGSVTIREMNGIDRDCFEQLIGESDAKTQSTRALFVSMHLCEPDGALMEFTDLERQQLGENMSGAHLDTLFDHCRELSGMIAEGDGDEPGN